MIISYTVDSNIPHNSEFHLNISAANRGIHLKVHKNENFFGSDFEFCTISLLVMLKF